MWTKLSADKKSELMKAYKKGGFSYRDMIDDYNSSYEEFEKGGKVEFNSGGEKHVVYRKESPTGNGKGVEGHIMINHPTKDKGKWDTIDLTDISNYKVKTIDQGIASTKKWHAENPEYKMGGMIKRADGSYSKRGLWDNIRANAGSGKAPTADMLEQERRIKNKFEEGGIEESINKRLGNPMLKAEIDSDYKGLVVNPRTRRQTTSESVDNVRHAAAGRYTQEAIENYANLIPYASAIPGFSKAAGFIGSNVLGLGHEASNLFNNDDDKRTMGMRVKESAADAYNNMIGSIIGASNLTPYQKNAYIKYLSETGKIPTGQYNKKKDPTYKKEMGGIQRFDEGGDIKNGEITDPKKYKTNPEISTMSPEIEPLYAATNIPELEIVDYLEPNRIKQQRDIIQSTKPKNNYAITDKVENKIYYYSPSGKIIKSEPVITGKSNNDVDKGLSMADWFKQTGSTNHEDYFKYLEENKYQTTPSGIYRISALRNDTATDPNKLGRLINFFRPERAKEIYNARIRDYGEKQKMFTLADEKGKGSSKAIHGTANPIREDAFAKNDPTGENRNLSNGCINVNGETICFDTLKKGSKMYVLPEENSNLLYPKTKNRFFKKHKNGGVSGQPKINKSLINIPINPSETSNQPINDVYKKTYINTDPDIIGGKYWDYRNPQHDSEMENTLEYFPYVGSVLSVNDAMNAYKNAYEKPGTGTYSSAALETLGMLPLGRGFNKRGEFITNATVQGMSDLAEYVQKPKTKKKNK